MEWLDILFWVAIACFFGGTIGAIYAAYRAWKTEDLVRARTARKRYELDARGLPPEVWRG
jgi:uncharacterized membrane protein